MCKDFCVPRDYKKVTLFTIFCAFQSPSLVCRDKGMETEAEESCIWLAGGVLSREKCEEVVAAGETGAVFPVISSDKVLSKIQKRIQ